MARGVRAVGRGVKKVASFVKTNWKAVTVGGLLAASAFFTLGASLGVTGGWAAKVGTFASKIGLGGKMGNIVAGAITQAGTGAWVGGAISAASGQGFMKGAALGAAGGAVVGGAAGAIRPVAASGVKGLERFGAGPPAQAGGGAATTATASPAVAAAGGGKSLFSRIASGVVGSGGIGPIVQGIGAGLGQAAAAKENRATRAADREDASSQRTEDRNALVAQRAWEDKQRRDQRTWEEGQSKANRNWQSSEREKQRAAELAALQQRNAPQSNSSYDIAYAPIQPGFARG